MPADTTDLDLTEAERTEVDAAAADANKKPEDTKAAEAAAAAATAQAEAAAAAAKAAAESPADDERAASAISRAAEAMERAAERLAPKDTPAKVEENKEPDWDSQRAELKRKYDANELDDEEYESARETLFETKATWRAERRADEIAAKRIQADREAQNDKDWKRSLQRFSNDADNAKFLADPTRVAAFRSVLNTVAGEMPDGTFEDWLTTAKDRVAKAFNMTPNGDDAEARAKKIADAQKERDKKAGEKPRDMNNAPAAGATVDKDNKFADLDDLNIDDLENTLAKMPEDKIREILETAPGGLKDNPRG